MAKMAGRILCILERIEKIPWQGVFLFTVLMFLLASVTAERFVSHSNVIYYGAEYGAVGAALAQGRGFSDPFSIGSGATAWVSPLLPAILGGIFYVAGFKTAPVYWIALILKIIILSCGAALIWNVLRGYKRGFAPVWYLWMGLFCWVHRIDLFSFYHDEWLIFGVMGLALWAWHRRTTSAGRIALMVAFSSAALSNPILWGALFLVMLAFSPKAAEANDDMGELRSVDTKTRFPRTPFWTAAGLSFLLIIGWTARNWVQMGVFAPIKANAGYEIYQAQMVSKNGVLNSSTFAMHPIILASKENHAYGAMGETAFLRVRRDAAIRAIYADPADFVKRTAQRFSNAFLFTASPVNTARIDSKINREDVERLRASGFVAFSLNGNNIWLDLDDPDNGFLEALPSIGLSNPKLAQKDWQKWADINYCYRFSWGRIAGGCLMGGLPWIGLLIAFLMGRRSAVVPAVRWAAVFLFLYLMPYVLISHYLRYQIPLLGMQSILLTAGTMAVLRTLAAKPTLCEAHPYV
jgi:hypothetical protein